MKEIENNYIEHLLKEIEFTVNSCYKGQKARLKTLYIGGGTPSLIGVDSLEKIFDKITKFYDFEYDKEVTLEIDPGTFDGTKLQQYQQLGINRFSVGIQSFDQSVLQVMNRSHGVKEIIDSLEILQNNLTNFTKQTSFDFIINLPKTQPYGQIKDIEQVQFDSIKKALQYNPGNLSIYHLSLEKNSILGKMQNQLPTDDESASNQQRVQDLLSQNGYFQYETCSYGKIYDGKNFYHSKHNQMYWDGDSPYFAFGMGASSLMNSRRFTRPHNITKYQQFVKNIGNQNIFELGELETGIDKLECILMGRLRNHRGLDLSYIENCFGSEIKAQIEQYFITLKTLNPQLLKIDNGNIKLNQGYLVVDEICAQIISKLKNILK